MRSLFDFESKKVLKSFGFGTIIFKGVLIEIIDNKISEALKVEINKPQN